jgi:hypothetical protein
MQREMMQHFGLEIPVATHVRLPRSFEHGTGHQGTRYQCVRLQINLTEQYTETCDATRTEWIKIVSYSTRKERCVLVYGQPCSIRIPEL